MEINIASLVYMSAKKEDGTYDFSWENYEYVKPWLQKRIWPWSDFGGTIGNYYLQSGYPLF